MEVLVHAFNRLTLFFSKEKNLKYVGTYHYKPKTYLKHDPAIAAHQSVVFKAFEKYLYPQEIIDITRNYRRSSATEEAILADFFANDVDPHEIPFDEHTENGLNAMLDAFRPPNKCMPCHLNDVEHHYPYKWQVNAEPPFSTDEYFLNNRATFRDFFSEDTQTFTKYVDPEDMNRRYLDRFHQGIDFLKDVVPAKFGFMKSTVFTWTRRWHHIIKEGFATATKLASDAYIRDRFIFPMLLHTKTAIVKKDDPDKMRTIWGCSKPWIIADTMLYWEYIAWVKLNPGCTPMLWGYETFTGGWLRLNAALFTSFCKGSIITLDWSRFDKRAYFSLIHKIMLGVRSYLDFDHGYVPNVNYPFSDRWSASKAIRLERLFLWTLENLFHAPIVLPDGSMYRRMFAGIPSGLFITQLLDSWYNYTMLATLLSALGLDPRTCIIKVQGDDSIIRLGLLLPPNEHEAFLLRLQELADYYFKAVISTDKSEIRNQINGCEVLSYRHQFGMPYRDEIKMLTQFYHTKARNPTPEITMAQAIGFAYASCGNHQRVLLVLKDVYEHYYNQGYTPNRAGLSLVFGDSPDLVFPKYDLTHFPSVHEIKQYLTNISYEHEIMRRRTWPRDYFIYEPCERV
uniref:RNA-dependent RNA polymerase n=1 Tax=Ceratobasidium partitivirus TaxID=1905681 RepID=A0A219WGI4_9VIRU|nr:RNA-dependent RNA polymerase [Ceratobasidium partitivirus]